MAGTCHPLVADQFPHESVEFELLIFPVLGLLEDKEFLSF
jgi:hypothetical protein